MKFVDDFVSYCRDFTGSPEPFLRWGAVLALSSVMGEGHVLRRGDWDVRPNLWILLLGNSSSYKSVALNSARRLLHEACPNILASQEYSHEALIEDIAMNPHKLFLYDEAESYFKMISQTYNAPMRSAMMSLYNGIPIQRQIKGKDGRGEKHTIDRAYICWGGASTPFQIAAHMNGSTTDLLSGMLPRFLMVSYFGEENPVADPPPANLEKRASLIKQLSAFSLVGEREYKYTPEALEAKAKWLTRFNLRANSSELLLSAFYRKLRDEHFHKVAMISACERGSTLLDVQDVGEAISLLWPVEREWKTLLKTLTQKEWDRDAQRVETFIQKQGQCTRRDILRGIQGIQAQKLSAILDGLKQDEKIELFSQNSSEPGRPAKLVKWIF